MTATDELMIAPTNLIAQAIEKGATIETLEKLMTLQERFEAKQAQKAFFLSLSEFQVKCPDLRKTKKVHFETKTGGSTDYNYAPLADIDRQIKETLQKAGFSKRWEIQDNGDKIKVTCIITHELGHSEKTAMEANPDTSGSKNSIQARGSAIEYMKRYTLVGALGLTTADSDIDGRLPELDIDKLHKQYMEVYNQIIQKDDKYLSSMDPDNWAAERTPQLYVKAIGKAREILSGLTTQKP
jgi:hypothetical protein